MLVYCPDLELRDARRAIQEAQRAIELNSTEGELGELAFAQSLAGQQDEALKSLAKAREQSAHEARLDLAEAYIRLERGEIEEARRLHAKGTAVIDGTTNRTWYTFQFRRLRAEFERRLAERSTP